MIGIGATATVIVGERGWFGWFCATHGQRGSFPEERRAILRSFVFVVDILRFIIAEFSKGQVVLGSLSALTALRKTREHTPWSISDSAVTAVRRRACVVIDHA